MFGILTHAVRVVSPRRLISKFTRMIPYSLGSSLLSATSGQLIQYMGYRPIIWAGFAIMTLGYGLMIMLDDTSNGYGLAFLAIFVKIQSR